MMSTREPPPPKDRVPLQLVREGKGEERERVQWSQIVTDPSNVTSFQVFFYTVVFDTQNVLMVLVM